MPPSDPAAISSADHEHRQREIAPHRSPPPAKSSTVAGQADADQQRHAQPPERPAPDVDLLGR